VVVSTKTALSGCPQGQRTGMYLGAFGCLIPNVCSQIKLFFWRKISKEYVTMWNPWQSRVLVLRNFMPCPISPCHVQFWVGFVCMKNNKTYPKGFLKLLSPNNTRREILLSTEHENEMLISVCFCWPITCWTSSTGNFSFWKVKHPY
jgi:hypothetical protein